MTLVVFDLVVLLGGIVALATHNDAKAPLGRRSTAQGRAELRVLERDPVLRVVVPATRPRSTMKLPAGKDLWNAMQPTEVRQLFDLTGDPGSAVDAFRAPAEAGGWRFLEVQCSPRFRSTSLRFVKAFQGFTATLQVSAHLERPYPESGRRSLLVVLRGMQPGDVDPPVAGNPESASLRRRDVHCLRDFDPSHPALQPPGQVARSVDELCALLPLNLARAIVPTTTAVQPDSRNGSACRYEMSGRPGFVLLPAPDPRSYYEDDQWAPAAQGGKVFLMEGLPGRPPNAVWIDTRRGPVRVAGSGTSDNPSLSAETLLAIGERLSA